MEKYKENTKQQQQQFILYICYVLLFCVFRAFLSVCFYRPFCHGALELDPIHKVCNTFLITSVSSAYIRQDVAVLVLACCAGPASVWVSLLRNKWGKVIIN